MRFPALCFPMLFAPFLAAQGPVLETHGDVGVFVDDGSSLLLSTTKARTRIQGLLTVQANTTTAVTASAQFQMQVTNGFVVVTLADRGSAVSSGPQALAGTTSSSDPKRPVRGPNAVLLTIPAPLGAKGRVRVRYSGKLSGTAGALATVDIANDNRIEFQQKAGAQVEKDFPATAGAGGFVVRIESDAGATAVGNNATAGYEAGLSVIFIPSPGCSFTPYGTSCGPVLAGRTVSTPGGPIVILELSKAPPGSLVGAIIGTKARNTRIPGTNCFLLAELVLWFGFSTNQSGNATQVLGAGPPEPFRFYAQNLILDRATLAISSSNGLLGDCK